MKIDDELYKELTEIWWDVLNSNKDVTRFKYEFYDVALNDGYELTEIEEYWRL